MEKLCVFKPGFHIVVSVVSVVSVVRKKFIEQIEIILSRTTSSICRFFCIEHLYRRFPYSCICPMNFFRTTDTTDTTDTTTWKPGLNIRLSNAATQHLLYRTFVFSTLPSFCGVKTHASYCIVTVSMWKFKDWASCFQVPDFNNLQTTRQNKTISIHSLRLCPAMKRPTPGRKCSRSAHRVSPS